MSDSRNAVHWFEIAVADLERATRFYEHVLAVRLEPKTQGPMKMAWFPAVPGAAGAAGMLVQGPGRTPSREGALVYFSVTDLDATLTRLEQAGGRIALPASRGDYGAIAHVEDSEGNLVAFHEAPQ